MSLPIIYFSVFLFAIIFFDALIRLLLTSFARKKYINYRVQLLEGDLDRKAVYERMLKERAVDYGNNSSLFATIRRFVSQANIKLTMSRVVLYVIGVFFAIYVVVGYFGGSPLYALIAGSAGTAVIAFLYVARTRTVRINRFLVQLPEAIDIMIRSLSAGHPLPTSVSLVAREMPDPIGTEFGLMSDEMTYGTDIDSATRNMVTRVGADDLNFLAVSLSVQRGSGGNLTEILRNLSDMLRKRVMMKAKIKAISAEGRWTAWFMMFFPFYLYLLINFLAPKYFDPIWDSGYGNIIVTAGLIIMLFGMIIIRKIVNFDF